MNNNTNKDLQKLLTLVERINERNVNDNGSVEIGLGYLLHMKELVKDVAQTLNQSEKEDET